MRRKKNIRITILILGLVLIGTAVYLYHQEADGRKRKQAVSNTTTEWDDVNQTQESTVDNDTAVTKSENATEKHTQEAATTAEKKQNKKLPDNYEWDEKRWGEPPQIVYDFVENQEKFDFIVNEIDSLLSEGEGFTTRRNNEELYSESKNGEQLENDINFLLKNTRFYEFTKVKLGHWFMYYDQEEDTDKYIYYMAYAPEMTEEEAWDNGYMKVVGDWYFATVWKI